MDKYKKKIEQICPQSVAGVAGCKDQQFIIQTNIKKWTNIWNKIENNAQI